MKSDRNRRGARRWGLWLAGGILSVLFVRFVSPALRLPALQGPLSSLPAFDGNAAYGHLVAQCDFGPRVPGSPAQLECRDYLVESLKKRTGSVRVQEFAAAVGADSARIPAFNIIARFEPDKETRILLCAHWDSRPWADQDSDPRNHAKPILGANDGASGAAVLLEIARVLSGNRPPVGVDIVLFDAEDLGHPETGEGWIQGSTHFVRTLAPGDHPSYGVLLDMIGDRNLEIHKEDYSYEHARDVVDRVWETAARLKLSAFKPSVKYPILDDHIPFLQAGIPCIDLIDFDYPFWHTLADTPDKCSPESLAQVGTLLIALVYAGD